MNKKIAGKNNIIKKLLNVSLLLELLYFVLCLWVILWKKPFILLYTRYMPDETFIDWPNLIQIIIITILFAAIYYIFIHKLYADKDCTRGFGIILGIFGCLSLLIIPSLFGELEKKFLTEKLYDLSQNAYLVLAAIQQILSYLHILLVAAVILIFCSYSMYWFKTKYDTDTQNMDTAD